MGKWRMALWLVALIGCSERVPSVVDAGATRDIAEPSEAGASGDGSAFADWPDQCPPPAIVARVRHPDGSIREGCFAAREPGLYQNFANCRPYSSGMRGELGVSSLSVFSNCCSLTRVVGESEVDLAYFLNPMDVSARWGLSADGCRMKTLRAGLVGAMVELELVSPCRLPPRNMISGVVVVESLRVRATVVQGQDIRLGSGDAGNPYQPDCGAARYE